PYFYHVVPIPHGFKANGEPSAIRSASHASHSLNVANSAKSGQRKRPALFKAGQLLTGFGVPYPHRFLLASSQGNDPRAVMRKGQAGYARGAIGKAHEFRTVLCVSDSHGVQFHRNEAPAVSSVTKARRPLA